MQKRYCRKHFGYCLGGIGFRNSVLRMGRQQVEQITSSSELRYYEKLIVNTKDIVQPNHIVVATEFTKNIYLLLQLGNVLRIIPEHDTLAGKLLSLSRTSGTSRHVPLRFSTRRDADLSIGSLPDDKVAMEQVRGTAL